MVAEIVTIVISAAAGSYATYALVTRHISARFSSIENETKQDIEKLRQEIGKYAAALDASAKKRFDDLKQAHISAIASQVKSEIKNVLTTATVETCSVCKRLVAGFETIEGKIVCRNCKGKQ